MATTTPAIPSVAHSYTPYAHMAYYAVSMYY